MASINTWPWAKLGAKCSNIAKLIIYWNLHYCQKHSFGNILLMFDENWTFEIDSVCLLNPTPKIGIFHAVFQIPMQKNHGQPWLNHAFNHGWWPWLTMVNHRFVNWHLSSTMVEVSSQAWSTMVDNAFTNHGWAYISVFQYFINIIKLWPEGQITDNLHFFKNSKILKALLIYKTIKLWFKKNYWFKINKYKYV